MLQTTKEVITWIQDYYHDNPQGKAIIGISGGKDSTVAAGLLTQALGVERVIFVMMPNGQQADIADSHQVLDFLNVPAENRRCINIDPMYQAALAALGYQEGDVISSVVTTNLPSRLRMSILYAIAAEYPDARVVNTCNRSEDYVGYSTKFGDAAGDFSPLGELTVREVLEIGDDLGMPQNLVHKAPSDGMSGSTDEDRLGFTYRELDDYLLGTGEVSQETLAKIKRLHQMNLHKLLPMPKFTK